MRSFRNDTTLPTATAAAATALMANPSSTFAEGSSGFEGRPYTSGLSTSRKKQLSPPTISCLP